MLLHAGTEPQKFCWDPTHTPQVLTCGQVVRTSAYIAVAGIKYDAKGLYALAKLIIPHAAMDLHIAAISNLCIHCSTLTNQLSAASIAKHEFPLSGVYSQLGQTMATDTVVSHVSCNGCCNVASLP